MEESTPRQTTEESTPRPTIQCPHELENRNTCSVYIPTDSIFQNTQIDTFFEDAEFIKELSCTPFTCTSVYEYRHIQYCVRFMNNLVSKVSLESEISIYRSLQEANYSFISNLVYADISNKKYRDSYFIFEYEEGYTLEEYCKTQPAISFEFAFHFTSYLEEALDTLHGLGVLHHDIKPANIYIPTTSWIPKLLDFGEAITFQPGEETPLSSEYYGSPKYSHPDSFPFPFSACKYLPEYDYYSVGLLLRDDIAPRINRIHERNEILQLANTFMRNKKSLNV
jgi:serine/threonine protein kinase